MRLDSDVLFWSRFTLWLTAFVATPILAATGILGFRWAFALGYGNFIAALILLALDEESREDYARMLRDDAFAP